MTPSFVINRRALAAWALFGLLSVVFLWRPLLTGDVLIPTSPRIYEPWSSADEARFVSNDLMSDTLILTYPWRLYSQKMLQDGEIPFWNPYIFSGYPHLAALQSNALYPPVVLFDLWFPIAGITYAMALHLALAGGLMFCFLRRLGVSHAAATFGGVAFELNGFFLVRMGAPSYVFSGIWTPLLLIGVRDLVGGAGWRASWKVVLPTWLALLGGHPQIFVLSLLIGGAYALFLAWPQLSEPSSRRRTVAGLLGAGLAVGLGVGLAGAQLLPFLELVQQTERSPVVVDEVRSLALPPAALAQGVLPDIFGHPVDRTYALEALRSATREHAPLWTWNYCGENLFTGITPLLFAVFALLRLHHREGLFFGFLAAIALLLLQGNPLVLGLFYEWIPTFQFSRPDRITYVYMLAVGVLAGLGYAKAVDATPHHQPGDSPSRFERWASRSFLILPLLPATLALAISSTARAGLHQAFQLIQETHPGGLSKQLLVAAAITAASLGLLAVLRWRQQARGLTLPIALAIAVLLAAGPLIQFGWRFNPVQATPFLPASPVIAQIEKEAGDLGRIVRLRSSALRPNLAQVFGIFDVNGASAATLERYTRVVQALDSGAVLRQKSFKTFHDDAIFDSRLLDFLGVRLVMANRPSLKLPQVQLEPATSGMFLFRNPTALPRFFLVDQIETYRDVDLAAQRLASPAFDPATVALVAQETQLALKAAELEVDAPVEVLAYSAHNIELRVRTGGPRLLVSSEVDYPGWEVDVDGQRARKVLVNTAFRGVAVEGGEHLVRFHFIPRSFYAGLMLSLLSLVLLIASLRSQAWFDRIAGKERPS